jgi:hypothetical protein
MTPGTVPVRVTVLDTWDEVPLAASADTTIAELKGRALTRAGVTRSPEGYVAKYRGGEVADTETIATAAIVPNAALIVLSRRRTPVR